MKTSWFIALVLCCCMASCNSAANNKMATSATEQSASATDAKHTTQYVKQRLTAIYDEAFRDQDHDLLALDAKFMSQEYNDLQNKAIAIAERIDDLVIDADHWVQGQDWTYPTMEVTKVDPIDGDATTAYVTITSHFPGADERATELILPMVFERGDWYIDNMKQYYEGELLDEKAWYKKYVAGDGKLE